MPSTEVPAVRRPSPSTEALLDGVLVGAGEGREDEVTAIRVAFVDRPIWLQCSTVRRIASIFGEVDLRVDALETGSSPR